MATGSEQPAKNPLREIVQPFIDVVHAPRALWGVNLGYVLEGMVYFGVVGYLAMYFNQYVGLSDVAAGVMVGTLTWGITLSMFVFGGVADKRGVRFALIAALALLLLGRVLLAGGPTAGLPPSGLFSAVHLVALLGILLVVLGYGMYQPAAYAAVRQFTTPETAGMAYAMLYALMNLGGWLPSFFAPVRRAVGISGAIWVYAAITAVALLLTFLILTPRTVAAATARAREALGKAESEKPKEALAKAPFLLFGGIAAGGFLGGAIAFLLRPSAPLIGQLPLRAVITRGATLEGLDALLLGVARTSFNYLVAGALVGGVLGGWAAYLLSKRRGGPGHDPLRWFKDHPMADPKFAYFIFCLIPVQTLFAHNWLTLPMYVARAYKGTWTGDHFEVATNFNPLLVFILVPIVAALTQKAKVYNMMIAGTAVMAAPTFLLALGPSFWTLFGYLVIMTVGEAMWQPRFLQYAAEIAPEGRTGAYMGVAQFPWFLTKVITSFYSGWFLSRYCPPEGATHTERMWLIYGFIAIVSSVLLFLARNWLGKDFKTKSD